MADESAGTVQDDYSSEPPRSSKEYLDAIAEAEKAFRDYHERADKIDKLYADLGRQADIARDREFQLFWANLEVLKPSIYARPPVPVVTPRFKDRRPVPRVASELLERSAIVAFELESIDEIMRLVRDDLAVLARGVAWVRYETQEGAYGKEKVCIEFVNRRDFLHDLARNWREVGWVARRAWLTKEEMKKRFSKASGDAYLEAEYAVQKDDRQKGAADSRSKAGVWEIWHKGENKVIWVTPGVDVVLDQDKPHLKLDGFFPCPKPAYGTLQRGSLVPVPDMLFYKDQLEEINELTARIASLSEAVKVRGFYPAGAGEIGDAIEAAIKSVANNTIMIPVSNWAAFGSAGAKDMIVWLPIDIIATTIAQLVELRRQLIEDVYQITGLSDIMRGEVDPNEKLGQSQLKSQYGSVRIRDRQNELVRVARDLVRIVAEIMAENFSPKTLLEMSQMEIPSKADIDLQVKEIVANAQAQVRQAMQDPQLVQQAQENPQAAEQMLSRLEQQTQAEVQKVQETVTIEQVMGLLREQRLRPFVLDIETDSTIQPDENAEKQRRTEFMVALGTTLQQLAAMVQAEPSSASFAGDVLKFAVAPFRVGRELEASIDEFVDQMKQRAGQPQPNPEAEKAQAEMALKDKELQGKLQIEREKSQAERERQQAEHQLKLEEIAAERERDGQKHQQEMEKGALELEKLRVQIQAMNVKMQAMERQAEISEASAVQQAEIKAQIAQQDADIRASQAERQAELDERAANQKAALAERQAAIKQAEPA